MSRESKTNLPESGFVLVKIWNPEKSKPIVEKEIFKSIDDAERAKQGLFSRGWSYVGIRRISVL